MQEYSSAPLGATFLDGGVRFSLWAPRATAVDLVLITDRPQPTEIGMRRSDDGVWELFVSGVAPGQLYSYRVDGPWDPAHGQYFNRNKLVLDPYAKSISGGVDFREDIRAHRADAPHLIDPNDSLGAVPLGVVVEDTPAPTPIAKRRSMADTVIYELHLRGFTKMHPLVPDHLRGSFLGLADPVVIEYLKDLGITAVELLPIHQFVAEPFVALKGLRNYWGYNTLGYFAPNAMYKAHGTPGDQIAHFKQMVSALHEADIEVILDVVYNHTAEGGIDGPSLSWRGIDQSYYYRMGSSHQTDYDVTGCGNSVNTANSMVQRMILDSMRYWVTEMGIDGFRFDLATTLFRDAEHHVDQNHELKRMINEDPVFEGIKMIAEPWDIGPFGYQVGQFGPGWSEWNDHFRDHIRDFWRGHAGGVAELATRLAGSADLFERHGRGPSATVNYVTAHDGFTMRDLVSYDVKHNQANGENNRDGTDNNRSWNHGWEGETNDEEINKLRRRQILNFHATQVLAVGTPMLVAGDEFGRTQNGNNNAYCQDSPVSWVNWDIQGPWKDVHEQVRTLLTLRAETPLLRRDTYQHHGMICDATGAGLDRFDLTWFTEHGYEFAPHDWQDGRRQTLGMYASDAEEALLIWFNASAEVQKVRAPELDHGRSYTTLWSSAEESELPEEPIAHGQVWSLPPRCVVIQRVQVATSVAELQAWREEAASTDA